MVFQTLQAQATQQRLIATSPANAFGLNSGKDVNAELLEQATACMRQRTTNAGVSDRRAQVASRHRPFARYRCAWPRIARRDQGWNHRHIESYGILHRHSMIIKLHYGNLTTVGLLDLRRQRPLITNKQDSGANPFGRLGSRLGM